MIDDRGGRSARERDPITGPPLSSSPAHLTDHHSDSETDPPENSYDCYFIMFGTVTPKTSSSPPLRGGDSWNPPREQIPDFQPLHPDDSGDSSDLEIKRPKI
ncbi:unnamed protein product [Bemisia tabaci]|uniref:Uncharacterized protein n=1 Tax=Bemisia tabaci TaxID=7038 RepID=A0A9P0A982_BEMTA|nr:unnamed protein product [Bemisia tabaci]